MGKPNKRLSTKPSPPSSAPTIPAPFSAAPESLTPLLSTLSTSSVYIIHIDSHPTEHKRRIFLIPILLNLTIALLLLWRLYVQFPFYISIIQSVTGDPNETTIFYSRGIKSVTWAVTKRGFTFLIDWLLFRLVGPWPWTFFFESTSQGGNPMRWRWWTGFREKEIYVRSSRGWGREELVGYTASKKGEDSPFFKTRVLPALDQRRLTEKTGYLLMDKDWDLDFAAMVTATRLVDRESLELDLLRKCVLVYIGDEATGQWCLWDCGKLDEGSESEGRRKIMLFKDKLTAMGKESLFFRWVELVQFESSAPGGFTKERQIQTAEKARVMFEDQGVDFERFVREVGGLEGLPGMGDGDVTC